MADTSIYTDDKINVRYWRHAKKPFFRQLEGLSHADSNLSSKWDGGALPDDGKPKS